VRYCQGVSVRLIVDGAVYMLAAREAMALVRRLRYREATVPTAATAAAVVLEWALAQERPPGVSFTDEEALAIARAAGRRDRALYRALALRKSPDLGY
jgi:hypothetical protein